MIVLCTMLVIGLLLGFVGAGGSGFIIAILTEVFGIPIHTALGTSLAAMVFTSLSGTLSHLRERNTMVKIGLATGLFGAVGAFFGSRLASFIPESELKFFYCWNAHFISNTAVDSCNSRVWQVCHTKIC